jgi:hypothetical protein
MERHQDTDLLLHRLLSPDSADLPSPALALVQKARESVISRKNVQRPGPAFLNHLLSFFRLDLKFYHAGLCLLLLFGGICYMNAPSYNSADPSGFIHSSEILSVKHSTVSVNSSTMLTSIPTNLIRN